jgi:hypothetical protein
MMPEKMAAAGGKAFRRATAVAAKRHQFATSNKDTLCSMIPMNSKAKPSLALL